MASPPRPHSRLVIVKVRIAQVGTAHGRKAAKLHLAYLEREGVERDGSTGVLYGADGPVTPADFNEELPGEERQFRIIISPDDGHDLDLKSFVQEYMQQVQEDLGRELRWAAVNHYNTAKPHAHVVIRGLDAKGAEVRLDPAYISHGMRHRAEDLATERLGPRPENARLQQMEQEVELHRYTSLDRELERRAKGGLFRVGSGKSRSPDMDRALRKRLDVLAGLGFVARVGRADWRLKTDLRARLQVMGRRDEGLRNIRSAMRTTQCRVIDPTTPKAAPELDRAVHGIVRWKGLDEGGRFVAVVETTGGVAYHLPVTSRAAAEIAVGKPVELKRAFDKDEHIDRLARAAGGTFDLRTLPEAKREAYRRRLEQLERVKLAAPNPAAPELWKVRSDFVVALAQAQPQPLWQALSIRPEQQSLANQTRYDGPVWLDRVPRADVGQRGFGAEVDQALSERHDYLRNQGLDPSDPKKLHWRLLDLQQERLGQRLAAGGGVPVSKRELGGFEGTARVHDEPNGQSFVEVRSRGGQFALVPATGAAKDLDGKTVRIELGDKKRARLEVVERERGPQR